MKRLSEEKKPVRTINPLFTQRSMAKQNLKGGCSEDQHIRCRRVAEAVQWRGQEPAKCTHSLAFMTKHSQVVFPESAAQLTINYPDVASTLSVDASSGSQVSK